MQFLALDPFLHFINKHIILSYPQCNVQSCLIWKWLHICYFPSLPCSDRIFVSLYDSCGMSTINLGKGHKSFCTKCPAHETNDAIIMAWPLTLLLFTCVGTYAVLGLGSFSSLHWYAYNSFFSLRRQSNVQKEAAHGASLLLVSQFCDHMTKMFACSISPGKECCGMGCWQRP